MMSSGRRRYKQLGEGPLYTMGKRRSRTVTAVLVLVISIVVVVPPSVILFLQAGSKKDVEVSNGNSTDDSSGKEENFWEEQEDAIKKRDSAILNPGCGGFGKTTVMIHQLTVRFLLGYLGWCGRQVQVASDGYAPPERYC